MKIILFILMTVLLTACSSMNSGFDCPDQAGVMCKSLDQINGMVDKGQIRGRSQESTQINAPSSSIEFQPYPDATHHTLNPPLRQGEMTQRVWIAPFEDSEGNYHEDNVIYTVVKEGQWIGSPVKPDSQTQ